MRDVRLSEFVIELSRMATNMYRLGWDERNGGNISYLLYADELKEYLDLNNVIREIPLGFDAKKLIGKYFLVTGTGKYFKNVERDPAFNLGILRIKDDGITAELLWGFEDGGKFTSEFPAHLMSHIERLKISKNHRVVLHTHPLATMAMSFVHPLSDSSITNSLSLTSLIFYLIPSFHSL